MTFAERLERICGQGLDHRSLRAASLEAIRAEVAFDAYVWVLTDPQTCVGSSPVAEVPSLADLATLIRLKYLTPLNRWTTVAPNTAVTLVQASDGDMSASRLWRELLAGYSVTDVVSMALCDAHGCWGFLDLWRTTGPFSSGECAKLETIAGIVTGALRRSLLPTFTFESTGAVTRGGPAVLLFSEDIEVLTQTPHTDTYLRALLPTGADHTPIPAAAYNVAAQLLATEHGVDPHPASTRIPLGNGHWVTLRAARINETPSVAASIAVTIEPTPPTERTELFCRISGLTQRESDVLRCLVDGSTTRTVAQRMSISDHTVQDHLKAIFAKTGATSRRVLTARATGAT